MIKKTITVELSFEWGGKRIEENHHMAVSKPPLLHMPLSMQKNNNNKELSAICHLIPPFPPFLSSLVSGK